MDAVQEVDSLIKMVREFTCDKVRITVTSHEYREFHDKLTKFIYRNHLDESDEWLVIQQNLIYKSEEYLVTSEADRILWRLEAIKKTLLKKIYEPLWQYIHPRIYKVAKERFMNELYSDSVEAAFKEINCRIKHIVMKTKGIESDGADLMRKCFSENNPILVIADMDTENGRNIQKGYMDMFAGAMTGIRNPKAHTNQITTKADAVRELNFASLLMYKIDQAINKTRIIE